MLKTINNDYNYSIFIEQLALLSNSKTIVEIGVQYGNTSIHLASVAKVNSGFFYGYDFWDEIGAYIGPNKVNTTKENIDRKLVESGHDDKNFKLTKIDTTSQEFEDILFKDTGGKIDFAFIDGDHSYNGIKNDFNKVYKYLTEEGIIVFHDTYSHVGCRKFVIDLYTELNDGTFDIINLPYGGGCLRYGLTVLVKISFPLYKTGIINTSHETGYLSSEEVYNLEQEWFNKEIKQ
jgi:hypothetical protein